MRPTREGVVPGAFHCFDVITRGAEVARDFRGVYATALRRALFPAHGIAEHVKSDSRCFHAEQPAALGQVRS